ncbi:replicative DNA helicase [Ferrimicrobium acidiphilum]|uniref:replicative DNA helicase n=1 Tax=Ferrimicrobium acidiphilum TaxID=121039 RepID=UPI0023EF739E|nr:DnaB helicase C-terminal domain-containing protein [Ferrimicrobium acidiphilum]
MSKSVVSQLEEQVVCAAICFDIVRDAVLTQLPTEAFESGIYAAIRDAIASVEADGSPMSQVVVAGKLLELGRVREGTALLGADLSEVIPEKEALEVVRSLRRAWSRRELRKEMGVLSKRLDNGEDPDGALEEIASLAEDATSANSGCVSAYEAVTSLLEEEVSRLETGAVNTTATGIVSLDAILTLSPQNFVVVGARPSVGKTAFALSMARGIAKQGLPVVFFSLEMSATELAARLLASESGILASLRTQRSLTDEDVASMEAALREIESWNFSIIDDPSVTARDVVRIAQPLLNGATRGLVVVDYIQLLSPSSSRRYDSRQHEVSEASRLLKLAAKKLQVPLLGISQINRSVEGRSNKRPTMSDLRDSGSLEQDSDAVLLLYRDALYSPDDAVDADVMEVELAKNRHGGQGTIALRWSADTTNVGDFPRSPAAKGSTGVVQPLFTQSKSERIL